MLSLSGESSVRVMAVLVFVAALLLLEGLYLLWRSYKGPEAQKLSRRRQALASESGRAARIQILKGKTFSKVPALERWLSALTQIQGLQRYVLQADLGWTVSQLLLASALMGALGFGAAVSLAFQPLLLGLAAGIVMAAVPWVHVGIKRSRRLAKIERQLPDALDFITRALRSGQAFTSALLMAGDELPEPIADEFRTAHDEITFGVSLESALTNMSDRLPITDVRYFVVSVLIQRDSGGNLTEVLSNLSRLIRERYKLISKIRVLSADGRFSALILVLAPFVLGAMMNLANPNFMAVLWTDPMGITIIKSLLLLMLIGVLILRKIVRIRV